VKVGEHDPRDRREVDLLGDARVLLELERADRLGRAVVARGILDRRGVQPRVHEDPLLRGLDHPGRDGHAHRPVEGVVPAPDPGGGREPADVEHLDLHHARP
jgi:hypothetical protein